MLKILSISIMLLMFSTHLCLGGEKSDKDLHKPKNRETPIWNVIKSPITGKCYEVILFSKEEHNLYRVHQGYGFMGMSEVSCKYLNNKSN